MEVVIGTVGREPVGPGFGKGVSIVCKRISCILGGRALVPPPAAVACKSRPPALWAPLAHKVQGPRALPQGPPDAAQWEYGGRQRPKGVKFFMWRRKGAPKRAHP